MYDMNFYFMVKSNCNNLKLPSKYQNQLWAYFCHCWEWRFFLLKSSWFAIRCSSLFRQSPIDNQVYNEVEFSHDFVKCKQFLWQTTQNLFNAPNAVHTSIIKIENNKQVLCQFYHLQVKKKTSWRLVNWNMRCVNSEFLLVSNFS